jgi:hypothetical protein
MNDSSTHWNDVYQRRAPTEVSWFQREARVSLELIEACTCRRDVAIVDVGAGASTLVDGLLARGFRDITLLDVAESALAETRRRVQHPAIQYVVSDITAWPPARAYAVWHDRAAFHFLTADRDRAAYRAALAAAVPEGGHVIIGTFAADGPERCSGLAVRRYTAGALVHELTGLLKAVETRSERHTTPGGAEQSFVFVRFGRV